MTPDRLSGKGSRFPGKKKKTCLSEANAKKHVFSICPLRGKEEGGSSDQQELRSKFEIMRGGAEYSRIPRACRTF